MMTRESTALAVGLTVSVIIIGATLWMRHRTSITLRKDTHSVSPPQRTAGHGSHVGSATTTTATEEHPVPLSAQPSKQNKIGVEVAESILDADKKREGSLIPPQDIKQQESYATYRGYPDTPENRQLLKRVDELSPRRFNKLAAQWAESQRRIDESWDSFMAGRIDHEEEERLREEAISDVCRTLDLIQALQGELRGIRQQLDESKRRYEQLYGTSSSTRKPSNEP